MSVAHQIQKRIDELRENTSNVLSEERKIAFSFNALPIYPHWSGFIAIRPDESFLFCTEQGLVENDVEPEWQLIALVRGNKQYPELKSLFPKRSTDAIVCIDVREQVRSLSTGKNLRT